MRLCGLLWLPSFLLCAAVAAKELIDSDSALMRGDYGAAVEILQERANTGDPVAMVRLGKLYHRGEGVKTDIDTAVALYLAAAELDHPEAQFKLGNMYLIGDGMPQDEDWAETFYRLAAKQGHAMADQNLREISRSKKADPDAGEVTVDQHLAGDMGGTEALMSELTAPQSSLVESLELEPGPEPVVADEQVDGAEHIEMSAIAETASAAPKAEPDIQAKHLGGTKPDLAMDESPVTPRNTRGSGSIQTHDMKLALVAVAQPPTIDPVLTAEEPSERFDPDVAVDVLATAPAEGEHALTASPITTVEPLESAINETFVTRPVEASETIRLTELELIELDDEAPPTIDSVIAAHESIEALDPTVIDVPAPPSSGSDSASTMAATIALPPVGSPISETVKAHSVDEAETLHLGQEHGIDMQLTETPASMPAASATAETTAVEVQASTEKDAFAERFESAQRAFALDNIEQGRALLEQLSEDGYAPAALLLADMVQRGAEGIPANVAEAMTWRQRAADRGSAQAQYQLAEMHMYGRDVEPDEAMAITFYRDAARGGHPLAEEKLRSIYAEAGILMPDFTRPRKPVAIAVPAPVARDPSLAQSTAYSDALTRGRGAGANYRDELANSASGGSSDDGKTPVSSVPLNTPESAQDMRAARAVELLQPAMHSSNPDIAVETVAPMVVSKIHTGPAKFARVDATDTVSTGSPANTVARPPTHTALPTDSLVTIEPAELANHEGGPGSISATESLPQTPDASAFEPTIESSAEPLNELNVAQLVDIESIAVAENVEPELPPDSIALAHVESPIEKTAEALSADEAQALRLAQEHGIEVQLSENPERMSVVFATARKTAAKETKASTEKDAFAERFEGAQRALALENFKHGRKRLEQLSEDGYAPAALLLADVAARGEGMPANAAEAMTWRQRAAALGSAEAQYQLAELYMHGRGIEPDEAMAITFYRDAARGGHPLAKEKLRLIYAAAGIPMPDFTRPRKPNAIYAPAQMLRDPTLVKRSVPSKLIITPRAVESLQPAIQLSDPEIVVETVAPIDASKVHTEPPKIAHVDSTDPLTPEPDLSPSNIVTYPSARTVLPTDSLVTIEATKPADHEVVPGSILATASLPRTPGPSAFEPTIELLAEPLDELNVADLVDIESSTVAENIEPELAPASVAQTELRGVVESNIATTAAVRAADVVPSTPGPAGRASVAVAAGTALSTSAATQSSEGLFGHLKDFFTRGDDPVALNDERAGSGITTASVGDVSSSTKDQIESANYEHDVIAAVVDSDALAEAAAGEDMSAPLTTLDDGKRALADGRLASAVEIFTRLGENGNAEAQALIGYMYYKGEGVEIDFSRAVEWYRRAAAQGNLDAQYNLAVAYAFGEGIAQDDEQAVTWYRRAADQGSAIAQYSLGVSYALGEGITQDYTEATRWYRAAAEQGYAAAQYKLGYSYRAGYGVDADDAEAMQWFSAAANGHAAAQYSVGYSYRSGRGVTRNLDEAVKWYRLAAAQGHPDAHADLASLNTDDL